MGHRGEGSPHGSGGPLGSAQADLGTLKRIQQALEESREHGRSHNFRHCYKPAWEGGLSSKCLEHGVEAGCAERDCVL